MRKLFTNFRWGFDGQPQSMLVEDGIVVERARSIDVAGEATDLGGDYLLPGFVDSHCHILPTGLDLQKLHLGACDTHADVLDAVRARHRESDESGWLMAVHYDQTRYEDAQHLTRHDLDKVSATRPILLRHVNGHASVVNSAALRFAGIAEDQADPEGGSFRRDAAGAIDGVLLELAHEMVTEAAPQPSVEQMTEAILLAGNEMAKLGVTCASDMTTGRRDMAGELEAYRLASERGCPVRLRMYLQWSQVFGGRAIPNEELLARAAPMDENLCRIAGIKIYADGAIGSATAAIYGQFTGEPANRPTLRRQAANANRTAGDREVSGQLIYSPDRLNEMVRTAHEAGYQVAIHSIGDYATDLVMDAYSKLNDPTRHRIEHAMILSDQQIEKMKGLGIHCAMQPEFLMRFGHSYRRQLGPERAAKLKRARSVLDSGIPLSFSSDRPIVAGNPWDGILTAVNRPEGFDPTEAVTWLEAVLAYTEGGARANRDENMGSLAPGHLADFQLYRENPLGAERPTPDATYLAGQPVFLG